MAPYSKIRLLSCSRSFIVTAALCLSLAGPLQAALVYSELFSNSDSTDDEVGTANWTSYSGATATLFTGTGSNKIYIPGGFGNGDPQTRGFLAFNALPNGNYVTYESDLSINPANGALNISWQHHANATGNAETRLLLQIGGQWVATNQVYNPLAIGSLADFGATGGAGAFTNSLTFSTTASEWRDVTFTPTIGLSISGTARTTDLTAALITAIGFYYTASGTVSTRIDTLQVNQVPEPHLTALLLAGGLGIAARRSR